MPIPKLQPEQGSIARGVIERGPRGKGSQPSDVTMLTDRKRKKVEGVECASLNVHHARRTRRSVAAKSSSLNATSCGDQADPVEVDGIVDSTSTVIAVKRSRQINVNKTSLAKYLAPEIKTKLQTILTAKSPG